MTGGALTPYGRRKAAGPSRAPASPEHSKSARLPRFAPPGAGVLWRLSRRRGYERRRIVAYGAQT